MNKTAAVVVNWNTRAALAECLRAALNEAERIPLEIVVVDNASADGSADMVAADFPSIKLIRNPVNAGFARAANIALRSIMKRGGVEFLLLLNPDAMVRPGAVEEMVRHLESRPEASACAPALLLPDGKFQAGAGGFLPTSRTAFVHFFFLSRLFPRRRRSLFLHQAAFAGSTEPAEVDWLRGLSPGPAPSGRRSRASRRALFSLCRGHRVVRPDEEARLAPPLSSLGGACSRPWIVFAGDLQGCQSPLARRPVRLHTERPRPGRGCRRPGLRRGRVPASGRGI